MMNFLCKKAEVFCIFLLIDKNFYCIHLIFIQQKGHFLENATVIREIKDFVAFSLNEINSFKKAVQKEPLSMDLAKRLQKRQHDMLPFLLN
ncbi:hypothetical protein [Bartonella raoultii]|uniref:hypothetical protein n=1 Tax=Bartonella raoultii TaxID=1457020 RepID=UPI001ABB8D3F|nr:hypothetical protein [Bartonella raoultii]